MLWFLLSQAKPNSGNVSDEIPFSVSMVSVLVSSLLVLFSNVFCRRRKHFFVFNGFDLAFFDGFPDATAPLCLIDGSYTKQFLDVSKNH